MTAGLIEVRDIPGEDPWGPGATSTARWRGARLANLLDFVGADPRAAHVAFGAPNVSQIADPPQSFGGSIPADKARHGEVLLAWEMNGAQLPAVHGAPVRVVVPGYIGARSVKWVDRITVQAEPSDNSFQATAYRLLPPEADPSAAGPGEGLSLGSIALNSDILVPDDGVRLPAGPTRIAGYALTGDDRGTARVDVSIDGGATWSQARLDDQDLRWAWRRWEIERELPAGEVRILARAWDTTAATQPESAAHLWNPKGYVNNAWARATVTTT